MNEIHEANRRCWERNARKWKECRDEDGLWRRCHEEPDLAFEGGALPLLREVAGDGLAGNDVCLVGSGDNYAAFALSGLGARVTSTDISQQQLAVAADRARQLGLSIAFVQADAADLHPLENASFDLVCSTNGFFVWIADVQGVPAIRQCCKCCCSRCGPGQSSRKRRISAKCGAGLHARPCVPIMRLTRRGRRVSTGGSHVRRF